MSPSQDNDGPSKQRPRAYSSFNALASWRRNKPDSASLSTLAAPIQTLPLDTLIEYLTPPAVPSLSHARSMTIALSTQTPAPSPSTMTPIICSLCSPQSPLSIQAAGFDILGAYCACGACLATSDRLTYFDLIQDTSNDWQQEIWESRLKALNAIFSCADDTLGVDKSLLDMLSAWLESAVDELMESSSTPLPEKHDLERSVDVLSEALSSWFKRIEDSGRMSDESVDTQFGFFEKLVDRAVMSHPEAVLHSSTPSTPFRENSSSSISTPNRHRRHPSSATNLMSPSNATTQTRPTNRHPGHLVTILYLTFLDSRIESLSPTYLHRLMPLLFRILSFVMTPLPIVSIPLAPRSAANEKQAIEQRVVKYITSLLMGPYSTICLKLLKKYLSPTDDKSDGEMLARTCIGCMRTLRLQVRQVLEDKMAKLFVAREMSAVATPAGAPAGMSVSDYVLERAQRAWRPDSVSLWDARKVGRLLVHSIRAWMLWPSGSAVASKRERALEEVACLLKDVLCEMDDNHEERKDRTFDDTARAVGETLCELVNYVKPLRNEDGTPLSFSLSLPMANSSPFLRLLAELLGRDQTVTFTNPPLALVLLPLAEHLPDHDTAKIPDMMFAQHHLEPTSSEWLANWKTLFDNESLYTSGRSLTRRAIFTSLQEIFSILLDIPSYRRPLMNAVFDFWMRLIQDSNEGADGAPVWKLLGDEVVLRSAEDDIEELFTPSEEHIPASNSINIHRIMVAMISVSGYCDCTSEDEMDARIPDSQVLSPLASMTPSNMISGPASPVVARNLVESPGVNKDKESVVPQQLMNLLSFATSGSRHQSQSHVPQLHTLDDSSLHSLLQSEATPSILLDSTPELCRGNIAAVSLINVLTQLAFTESVMTERQAKLAIYVFGQLLKLLRTAQCAKTRLTILQALMRLRADRDHRVYIKNDPSDNEPHILTLASLVDRVRDLGTPSQRNDDSRSEEVSFDEFRKARPKQILVERDGRRASRGRGSRTSTGSRSRSRVTTRKMQQMSAISPRQRGPLWYAQDAVPFMVENEGKASQLLITYDPHSQEDRIVLPVSDYMDVLVEILKAERDWEVLSFVLVYLPPQLANKHFWCGPKAKASIKNLLAELVKGVSEGSLAKYIPPEDWPGNLKQRDAVGLAYHTLTVLISYQSIFEMSKRHSLVEVFQLGLSGIPTTVTCCLNALSLCAFEMQTSMIRALPRILEKLSQIMTNPSMVVHILTFLNIVGSAPSLHASFTEDDFKMVFGVALQYLQHHNRPETLNEIPFALSQHVRIMSFYVVYVWFLVLKLADRPRHINFITRQMLLANEGREQIDTPTEVCFDFLARNTYATADPKPARSMLDDILSAPTEGLPSSVAVQEKTWVLGYSVITVKTLAKPGWIEVITRRASGTTKFLCRNENFPIVDLGDVEPDVFTLPSILTANKDPRQLLANERHSSSSATGKTAQDETVVATVFPVVADASVLEESRPDDLAGFVWSGSAPSQRRKRVEMDPSFFSLQFSSYPSVREINSRKKLVKDTKSLGPFIRSLDRLPVIDTHKIGILYVAPGQTDEVEILKNSHGSPAYTRFLEGLGRLIKVGGQHDVYIGGLEPDEDGDYAYAWWDDIGQMLFHTATLMPTHLTDEKCNYKKRHIGNDLVRIVWNDSGFPYRFETISTEFQFVNIVIEPHSRGVIAAYSNNLHENEYFKVTIQQAEGMVQFTPVGDFKVVSALSLPLLVRQLALVADWYASIFKDTVKDTQRNEIITNWRARLESIKKFSEAVASPVDLMTSPSRDVGIMSQERLRDFAPWY